MINLTTLAQLVISGLAFGCIYAMLAVSFTIVLDAVRVWNFAAAAVYTIVAYIVWIVLSHGLPIVLALAIGFVVAAGLMVLADVSVHDPLRRRRATGEIVMVGSITVTILVSGLLGLAFGSESHGVPGGLLGSTFNVGPVVIVHWDIAAYVAVILTLSLVLVILYRTQVGRAIRAYGDNAELSIVMGQRRFVPHLGAYVVASVPLVPAAALVAINSGVDPGMGLYALLIGCAAAILGGIGNVSAAATGGLLLGVATSVPMLWLSPAWQSPIAFGILLVVILLRPQGIFTGRLSV